MADIVQRTLQHRKSRKSLRTYFCADCAKANPAMFILKGELWDSVAKPDEILCFSCTENRLGRRIRFEDLSPCLITDGMLLGAYMTGRGDKIDVDESLLKEI